MYTRLGIHELKHTPDNILLALNPQVVVTAGTYEHDDAIRKHRERVYHLKQLLPNAIIGVRWWQDDHILNKMQWEEYAERFFPLHVPGTLLMVGNEDPNDPKNIAVFRDTINKHIQVMRMATDAGIALGTCCLSTGNPAVSQYKALLPLFNEMREARGKGIVHWWRPNAYFTMTNKDDVYRPIDEIRRITTNASMEMPPMFLGELAILKSMHNPYDGYHSMGMGDQDYVKYLRDLDLTIPAAIYAHGVGIYDTAWRDFALTDGFYKAAIQQFQRTSKTAYEEWFSNQNQLTKTARIVSTKANYVNVRIAPNTSAKIIGSLVRGNVIEYQPNAFRDEYDRYWHKLNKPLQGYFASWVVTLE